MAKLVQALKMALSVRTRKIREPYRWYYYRHI